MAKYTVNEPAVAHARQLIDARRYVLRRAGRPKAQGSGGKHDALQGLPLRP